MKLLITYLILALPGLLGAQDMRRVKDLRGHWKFSIGDEEEWKSPSYDDGDWEDIFVPSPWENEGFSGFDGYAWYRKTVTLSGSDEHLYLMLGYIDDVDQVYFNGQLIGFSGSFPPHFYTAYNSMRKYYIPKGLINRNGENTIAVRVYDTVLDGGIIKGDIGIYTHREEPKDALMLEGLWKFREGTNQWWKEVEYDDHHWNDILIPGFWRSLKEIDVRGEAWYRKSFNMPPDLRNADELVLVMGLIDDFDETYFNGVLVGSTNDHKSFGQSNSWRTYRVYHIPESIIDWSGINTVAVHVSDLGGNAGIYHGPLAVVPYNQYKQLIRSSEE